jgi:hypothetical protein
MRIVRMALGFVLLMAKKLRTRIIKAVTGALGERDRIEMRAMDALLSTIETPKRRRRSRRSRSRPRR